MVEVIRIGAGDATRMFHDQKRDERQRARSARWKIGRNWRRPTLRHDLNAVVSTGYKCSTIRMEVDSL